MEKSVDEYAKGMSCWEESDDDVTSKWDEFQYSQFRKYLSGDMLEVGAGYGRISRLIINENKFDSLTLTEPYDVFCSRLKKYFANEKKVTILNTVIQDMAESKKSFFDVIYSTHVLEHIEDDKECLQTCLKLIKEGGLLIFAVPALNFLYSSLDKEIGHFRRYDKSMVNKLVRDLGVEIVDMHYSDFIGVIGSFLVSKVGKRNYQGSGGSKKSFLKLVSIYSNYVVPISRRLEQFVKPPIGLNLTVVLRKKSN